MLVPANLLKIRKGLMRLMQQIWLASNTGLQTTIRNWGRGLAIAVLVICLTACGSAPQSVVEEALAYERKGVFLGQRRWAIYVSGELEKTHH